MARYDNKQIARELQATAQDTSYYGNALYVALDFPGLDRYEKIVLRRWLRGSQNVQDRFELQNIANKIAQGEPTP